MQKSNNDIIRELKRELGYTSKELARALHVSPRTIRAWFCNPASPHHRNTPDSAIALAGFILASRKDAATFPHGEL